MKLTGIKVLDLSAFLPGPHMTMTMSDHGADVIMVEPANGVGEPVREIGEMTDDGFSVWFRNIARGKRSLKLNLKEQGGKELFYRLAKQSDVIVEAFRPGVVKRLNVDYETISGLNPRIVYCSISAFGQGSSLSYKPSHDTGVQAMAGLIDLNRGLEDNKPAMPSIPFADAAASLTALSAISMALYRRESTGQGDFIDISMYDAAIAWTPNVLGPTFANNEHPPVKSMRSFGGSALTNLYETLDGKYIAFSGPELKFAKNLLVALQREDLYEIAKLPPGEQTDLVEFLKATIVQKPLDHWKDFLEPVDCAWAWVRSLKEAFDDPFTSERWMVFFDEAGYRHVGVPIKFQKESGYPKTSLSQYGQDGEGIAEELGYSADEIRRLMVDGII